MIHTGTMYQYYFFHHDADRHFFKILNVAIPTGSIDRKSMLHVNVNSIKNVTKKTGMGEVDFIKLLFKRLTRMPPLTKV